MTKPLINFRPILRVISVLLLIIGGMMLTGIPFSLYYGESPTPLIYAGFTTIIAAALLWFLPQAPRGSIPQRNDLTIRKREGYLIVALSWTAMVSFGMLPYLFSGMLPSVPDALFETVSGMTTTGASTLTDIEIQPRGLLCLPCQRRLAHCRHLARRDIGCHRNHTGTTGQHSSVGGEIESPLCLIRIVTIQAFIFENRKNVFFESDLLLFRIRRLGKSWQNGKQNSGNETKFRAHGA